MATTRHARFEEPKKRGSRVCSHLAVVQALAPAPVTNLTHGANTAPIITTTATSPPRTTDSATGPAAYPAVPAPAPTAPATTADLGDCLTCPARNRPAS